MAAGGQGEEEQEPMDFELGGLDIDAALFAEPEAHVRPEPTEDHGDNPEGRAPVILRSPIRPSAEDVDRHDATHVPYRNWCPMCVAARGKEAPHKRQVGAGRDRRKATLPKVSLDYQELKSKPKIRAESQAAVEDANSMLRIVVGKDEATGMMMAHRVITKGPTDEWVTRRLVKDIEELGRGDIILKTDGEPAMIALQRAIAELRKNLTTKPENPPAYNPEANGAAEKAVQDVSSQIRTLKLALEARLGITIPESSAVVDWIIEHAAFVLSRFSVGHDGMTPYERLTGRKWARPMIELGEVVLAKFATRKIAYGKKKAQTNKLMPRSIRCILVGQMPRTGEHVVIKPNGDTARCRTIFRVPLEDRWDAEEILNIRATPRSPTPSSWEGEIRAPLAEEASDDADRRKRRRGVLEEQVAQELDSGAGLPRPEKSEPLEPGR